MIQGESAMVSSLLTVREANVLPIQVKWAPQENPYY